MTTAMKPTNITILDGNEAAATGVALARLDMIAVHPITPQTSLVEKLTRMIADGTLDADLLNVEGEHSVLSALQGAELAGARTYTATSGPGLAFMFELYVRAPGLRMPMVVSLGTRDTLAPSSVWGGASGCHVGSRGRLDSHVLRDGAGDSGYRHHGLQVIRTS
jgi:pyruvate ferredoxin oxidoreductase alpha subunit/phenylglyoxylate dehydrogenase alpha subunit